MKMSPMNWKLTWNPKKYDYNRRMEIFRSGDTNLIYQAKGNQRLKILPKIGDNIYISCDKKLIMSCVVMSDFKEGKEAQLDECNLDDPRFHASEPEYVILKIVEIYDNPKHFIGFQGTWKQI